MEDQERSAAELRARAGALIAAAAVATSFLGPQTLAAHDVSAAAWVAIGCFIAVGCAVLLVLWPGQDWVFSIAPCELITTYLEPPEGDPLTLDAIQRDLALHMGRSAEDNRRQLERLTTAFRAGVLLLVVEMMAWVFALLLQR
ncbi:MAG TPA: hypothetical protein VGP17_05690 [Solirubrobacteraceae bacterium]|nr:hypothetical protein [Solirubrobacteraceae bacterium]